MGVASDWGLEKLYFGGVWREGWGGGGVGGWGVHKMRACTSEVPGGCAKTTDLSNY